MIYVIVVFAGLCSCAKSLSTNPLTPIISAKNTVRYRLDVKNSNGNSFRSTGHKIQYRLNDGMLIIGDGKVCIDDKVLAALEESDLVTVEGSRTVAVNGTVVWPDDSK